MNIPPRKTLKVLLAIFGVFLVLYFAFWREPHYKGKSVTTWFEELDANDSDAYGMSADALRHLGPKAVPPLLKQLHYTPSTVRFKLRKYVHDHHWMTFQFYDSETEDVQVKTINAFMIIGPDAKAAAPDLAAYYHERGKLRVNALTALRVIGWEALKELVGEATDTKSDLKDRLGIINAMGELSTNGVPAVPTLLGLLKDSEPNVRLASIKALGMIAGEPDKVVPALAEKLSDSQTQVRQTAARALSNFKKRALAAVPALQKATGDSSEDVSEEAKRALRLINPQPGDKPAKEERTRPDRRGP